MAEAKEPGTAGEPLPAGHLVDSWQIVLIGAVVLRLLWLHGAGGMFTPGAQEAGEATRVAVSLAQGRGFGDAFPGMGATAHLLPFMPAVAGALISLFGGFSAASVLALTGWAMLQTCALYLLLARLFDELGLAQFERRIGFGLLCLVPVFAPEETVAFRYWEGAFGASLGVFSLTYLLRLRRGQAISTKQLVAVAAISSVCFLVSPPVGVAAGACWGYFAIANLRFAQLWRLGLMTFVAFAAWMVPWAIRNAEVMGAPVLVRSNFGLELAIANHSRAVSNGDRATIFKARLMAIHPYHGHAANERARALGEVVYSRQQGDFAKAWIANNPLSFLWLSAQHYSEFFFPRAWQFTFSQNNRFPDIRSAVISIVNALGIAGLALNLRRRRPGFVILAFYLALVALPYAVVQPIPRYTYLVYGLFCFLAAELIVGVFRRVGGRQMMAIRA